MLKSAEIMTVFKQSSYLLLTDNVRMRDFEAKDYTY